MSSDETFSEKEVLNEIENIFVFSLSSSNTSECFGELEKAVKTRNAGEKYDCFYFFYTGQRFSVTPRQQLRTAVSCRG